jgi:hypothetical protein
MLVGAFGTTTVPSPVRVRQLHPRAHTRIGSSHELPHDHLSPCTCTIYRALPTSRQSSNVPVHKDGDPLPWASRVG